MTNRPKIQISHLIKDSRLTKSLSQNNYTVLQNLVSDIHIKSCDKHLIFLPVLYHSQNPRYLEERLKKMKVLSTDKIVVMCLVQNPQENIKVANIQMECLKADVNLMVCFDIEECRSFIYDMANK